MRVKRTTQKRISQLAHPKKLNSSYNECSGIEVGMAIAIETEIHNTDTVTARGAARWPYRNHKVFMCTL